MAKKKITLESISKSIGDLAAMTTKSIDDLAAMTARGFEEVRTEFREEIGFVRKELKSEIIKLQEEMHIEFADTNKRITYQREEMDAVAHRVKALETHTRIHHEDR